MILKKCIFALTLVATASFAYFNEDDYQYSKGDWSNFNNTPTQNRYEYYKQGVVDTLNILNDEQSNFFLDGKKVEGINSKFIVIRELNKNNLADYIFMRSVSSKIHSQYPIAVIDESNRAFLIFGYFDDKNSATLLVDKLKAYSINAEIIKPGTKKYFYRSPLKNSIIDEKTLENLKNNPAKIIVVERTRYINGSAPKNTTKTTKNSMVAKKVTQKQQIKKETKVNSDDLNKLFDKNATTISQTTELSVEDKIKCLEWLKNDLIQNGFYNIETKQIKYKGQIYGVGDNINFSCSSTSKSDFKITQMVRVNKNMSIIFNNLVDKKLDIMIKYPQIGFVTVDDLFYNPDQKYHEIENVTFIQEENKNESKVIAMSSPVKEETKIDTKEDTKQNLKEKLIDSAPNFLHDFSSNATAETKPISAITTGTEQATCSFKVKDGIRTQVVKQANGEYEIKAIPVFYKNKILPVEYFISGDFMAVTAIGAQSILINKEHFDKYCH